MESALCYCNSATPPRKQENRALSRTILHSRGPSGKSRHRRDALLPPVSPCDGDQLHSPPGELEDRTAPLQAAGEGEPATAGRPVGICSPSLQKRRLCSAFSLVSRTSCRNLLFVLAKTKRSAFNLIHLGTCARICLFDLGHRYGVLRSLAGLACPLDPQAEVLPGKRGQDLTRKSWIPSRTKPRGLSYSLGCMCKAFT